MKSERETLAIYVNWYRKHARKPYRESILPYEITLGKIPSSHDSSVDFAFYSRPLHWQPGDRVTVRLHGTKREYAFRADLMAGMLALTPIYGRSKS